MPTTTNYQIVSFHAPLLDTMERFEITNKKRQCAFLANVAHESGCLRYVKEISSGAKYDRRKDLGNLENDAIDIAKKNGTTAGRFYKGRGVIQLTGFYNYKELSEYFNVDFINKPQLLEQPKYACLSAGWFWNNMSLNDDADRQLFDTICDKINKGRKTKPVGDANGYNDRLYYYERAWSAL